MNVNVAVKAEVQPDGTVRCRVECDGQQAALVFDGQEVLVEIPELAQQTP